MQQQQSFFCPDTRKYWHKCVALVDMVAFFPSCEQLDNKDLQGKPIGVINGDKGNTIISSSYEARAYGVKTGMKVDEATKLCSNLIICPSRPDRYAEISGNIMQSLTNVSPDIRVFSIDECFINLKPVLNLYGSVKKIADLLRKTVLDASGGLNCSIGISEGQLTAKFCARNKGKTTIIPPNEIKEYMANASIGDICGIGKNTEEYLNKHNVYQCKDIENIPISVLSKRFGDIGKRLYLTCLGNDPLPVDTVEHDNKSMGHGKVLNGVTEKNIVRGIMSQLNERLARRLRKNEMACDLFYIGFKTGNGWVEQKYKTHPATNCSDQMWLLIKEHFKLWKKQKLYQLQITALSLQSDDIRQIDLFADIEDNDNKIDRLKDEINAKFGKASVRTGIEMLADDTNMVPVIAFNFDAKGKKNSL